MIPLTRQDKRVLLDVARQALVEYLESGETLAPHAEGEALLLPRASFVTLSQRETGQLRGCRGETRASRPLVQSVIAQAIAAAVDDPRFESVKLAEAEQVSIHISALSGFQPIEPAKIELGRHGLLVTLGAKSGLLLPQVPAIYGLKSREEFLKAVCRKALLPANAWLDPDVTLLGFEAESWGEADESPG